jgi:hypothetical protein
MNIDWQDATALVAVIAASGYLARRAWFALARKRSGCGGCGGCPSVGGDKTLVVLELKHQPVAATTAGPRLPGKETRR